MEKRIITALDVPGAKEAYEAVKAIGAGVDYYKVGLELFIADGPAVLNMLKGEGKKIFLDLKLHDIPRTVERAVSSCLKYDVDMLTIHSTGASAMIQGAAKAIKEANSNTTILAVTVLTSLDQSDMTDIGVTRVVSEQVEALGKLAVANGAGGLVCSPKEVKVLRTVLGSKPVLVTPGVRPAGGDVGDQKRVATPGQAILDGSSYLVVGRPIMEAVDKYAAAMAINDEVNAALAAL